jgi:hypothetical protein
MANWYIDDLNGNDSAPGDGSQALPYKTLGKAISSSASNDTIYCADGLYDDEVYIDIASKTLTIESTSGDFRDVIFKPKTLGAGLPGLTSACWIRLNYNLLTIKDCSFVFDMSYISNVDSTHYNSVIESIANAAATKLVLVRCFFLAQNWSGASVKVNGYLSQVRDGVEAYSSTFRGFVNGTNFCAALGVVTNDVSTVWKVKNCIFEGNRYAIGNAGLPTVYENNNCFYNNTNNRSNGLISATDLTTDPKFKSATSGKISGDSPCVDAGVVVTGYIEDYWDLAPEIGCFEIYPVVGNFTLKWGLFEHIENNFKLKWGLWRYVTDVITLKWGLEYQEKLFNIVNYPLFFVTPAIYEFLFTSAVSGILDSVNVSLGNTGNFGDTIIEIYYNNTINTTVTIPATGVGYNKIIALTNSIVKTKESIKIKITEAAMGSSNLVVVVNQRTFSPEIRISNVYNKFSRVS